MQKTPKSTDWLENCPLLPNRLDPLTSESLSPSRSARYFNGRRTVKSLVIKQGGFFWRLAPSASVSILFSTFFCLVLLIRVLAFSSLFSFFLYSFFAFVSFMLYTIRGSCFILTFKNLLLLLLLKYNICFDNPMYANSPYTTWISILHLPICISICLFIR